MAEGEPKESAGPYPADSFGIFVSAVSQSVCSCQHILQQDLTHLFRLFKYWAVSRLLKRIESFDRRVDFLKVGFCLGVGAGVIMNAMKEINGNREFR
jgi:hypothetical protein